jgi:hypothetical protein
MAKPQEALDNIWAKYRKSLNDLNSALDENEALRADADIDFTMPNDIKELEAKIEQRLSDG